MKRIILASATFVLLQTGAIQGRTISDYINWGPTTHDFPAALKAWEPGKEFTSDDNFFISRVKPKARFRNMATQIHSYLTPEVDKNLIYWVPIGTPPDNGLPSGNFDSDVFSMWSYVTHFGDWSAPMARIPGNFADAAHRNGVGVSPVLSIPWGTISADWSWTLRQLLDVGPEKMSEFLEYYGIDGLGYNSEFSLNTGISESRRPKSVGEISTFNSELVRIAGEKGRSAFMNIWYDGTSDSGSIKFDKGLKSHNYNTFGAADKPASSLFFNYNWNSSSLLEESVNNANSMGRSPLDLYAGFNMQGGEPRKTLVSWSLLKNYPISIGLWGAHSESMMYESRREMGATPLAIQTNYLNRTEWWFSGGTRNPASAPEVSDKWNYSGENTKFFGMAKLMSARSSLTEPFVTNFNIGNGSFFNFKGERQSDTPWANIGIQDILPTWRFWWSSKLLGGDSDDVPQKGLDATFVWDDAWLGGSSLKISGNIDGTEYLHLFKTSIAVENGDNIFVRYKLIDGSGEMSLVLTEEGKENTEIVLPVIMEKTDLPSPHWRKVEFSLNDVAPQLAGKKISLVALKFMSVDKLDMRLGGFGISDNSAQIPPVPIVTHTELLSASTDGIDGKIIWDMPEGKEKRYNEDQGVSFFQLYYQQEGGEPVMQSGTSSWAGLLLGAKIGEYGQDSKFRFGVASVGTDFMTQSEIAWGEWHDFASKYALSHDIESYLVEDENSRAVSEVCIGKEVGFKFKDSRHAEADWTLLDSKGEVVSTRQAATSFEVKIAQAGMYSLRVAYKGEDGKSVTDEYPNFLYVLDEEKASAPKITDFQYELDGDNALHCYYEAESGAGKRSRALQLDGKPFGMKSSEVALTGSKPWAISFWIRPEASEEEDSHLVSVRDKTQAWSKNEWGYLWSTVGKNGKGIKVSIRKAGDSGSVELRYDDVRLTPGIWTALGFSFGRNASNALDFGLYVNGEKVTPNSYKDSAGEHSGAPSPMTSIYTFSRSNVLSVGGNLFKNGGVEGAIDNFCYWAADLAGGRAALAMGDIDRNNPPEGLDAFYSFEQGPSEDLTFTNELTGSAYPLAKSGRFMYVPQLTEGSGVVEFVAPIFCAGSPMLGEDAIVDTEVKWIAPGARVVQNGDSKKGDARLIYPVDGVYRVRLRLENPCGYDEREISMINVPRSDSVSDLSQDMTICRAKVAMSDNGIFVLNFESEGKYDLEIITLDGRVVRQETISSKGGQYQINGLPVKTPLIVVVK